MMRATSKIAVMIGIAAILAPVPVPGQVKDHRKLEFPVLPELSVPRPEIHELDNRMKVLLLQDHELPLISVSALIRGGSVYEPEDKTGLAELFGQVIPESHPPGRAGRRIAQVARLIGSITRPGKDLGRNPPVESPSALHFTQADRFCLVTTGGNSA